jgi:hypothetical protein
MSDNHNNNKVVLDEMALRLTLGEVCLKFSGVVLPLNWVDPIARLTIETYLQLTKDSDVRSEAKEQHSG